MLLEQTLLAGYEAVALFLDRGKVPVDIVADLAEVVLENKNPVGMAVAGLGLVFVPVDDVS